MTQVTIDLRQPQADGTLVGVPGAVQCTPTSRHVDVTTLVLPVAFAAQLVGGMVTVELEPTTGAWVWQISERVTGGSLRYVAVPDSPTPVAYTALVDIDPATLVPAGPAPADAWTVALDTATASATSTATTAATTATTQASAAAGSAAAAATSASTAQAVLPGGATTLDGATAALVGDGASATSAALASPGAGWGRGTSVATYGAKGDGVTDDTAAIQAAIDAVNAAGGGLVWFPRGHYVMTGTLTIPDTGGAPVLGVIPQNPLLLKGEATSWLGDAAHATPLGGTVLDFRAAPTVAHIDTRGCGHLGIEDLTLTTTVSGKPFVFTTNTTLSIQRVRFLGPSTEIGTSCTVDAVWFGGSGTTFGMTAADGFQGYGSRIVHCQMDRIQRGMYGRAYCNSVMFVENFYTRQCGGAAALEIASLGGAASTGNFISGNLFEMDYYAYGAVLDGSSANYFAGNSWWDYLATNYATAMVDLRGMAGNSTNNSFTDFFQGVPLANQVVDSAGGNQWGNRELAGGSEYGLAVFAGGGNNFLIQPPTAQADAAARLLRVLRSSAESVSPDLELFYVQNDGRVVASGVNGSFVPWSGNISTKYSWDGVIRDSGNLDLYPGTDAGSAVVVRRGTFKTSQYTTAARPAPATAGQGAEIYDTTLNLPVWSDGTNWKNAAGAIV